MQIEEHFSENPRIDRLLRNVVNELRAFTEEQAQQITDLVGIGKAMSAEHDPANVLDLILSHARKVTKADAGIVQQLASGEFSQAVVTYRDAWANNFNIIKDNALGFNEDMKAIDEAFKVDQDALDAERKEAQLQKQAEFEGKMTALSKKEQEQRLKDQKTFFSTLASLQSANSKIFVAIGLFNIFTCL